MKARTEHCNQSSDPHPKNRHGAFRSRKCSFSAVAETPIKQAIAVRAATQTFNPLNSSPTLLRAFNILCLLLFLIAVAPLHKYISSVPYCNCRVRSLLPSTSACSATPPPPQQTSFIYSRQSTRMRYEVLQ